jgi:hypothetical protein
VDGHTFHLDAPPADTWTQLVLTFDGLAFRAYYDGVLKNDYIVRAELPALAGPLVLGTRDPAGPLSAFYSGGLADFRFYDRALDQLELLQAHGKNSPPSATPFTRATAANLPLPLALSGQDLDGSVTAYQIVTPPANGSLDGSLPNPTYTPAPGFTGSDTFTYRCSDGTDWSPPVTVTLNVASADLPIAQFQDLTLTEDARPAIVLTGLNLGADLTYTIVNQPRSGTVSGTAPNLTYVPKDHFSGDDRFTFRITDDRGQSNLARIRLNYLPVNDPPTVNRPPVAESFARSTAQDTAFNLRLIGSDPEGRNITAYKIIDLPKHGTLSGSVPGQTYTPAPGFTGTDTFTYLSSNGTDWSQPATVTIEVLPLDLPVAQSQRITTPLNTAKSLTLGGSNLRPGATYTIVTPPANGTLSGTATAANRNYTPAAGFTGADFFTFRITDSRGQSNLGRIDFVVGTPAAPVGTPVVRLITARADASTAFTLPVTDPDDHEWLRYTHTQPAHGTLTGQAPYFTYTPAPGYVGPDSFTFTAYDGVHPTVTAIVPIHVRTMATYDVRTFGAVGDGVADDTLPIRAAIRAAEDAGGGTVYFPPGTYAVAPQATDPSWINDVQPTIFDISSNHIELRGDGHDRSIISAYTIGLADPMTNWTVIGDGSGYFKIKRGGAFALTNRRVPTFENIAFRGLRITGNTRKTGNKSVGGIPATGDGWDMSHKGIKIPDSIGDYVFIEDCRIDGWRGEVIYGGGDLHNRIFVRDTLIHDSNASAISIGSVTCERVTVYDVYNGFENLALVYPQRTIVKDCDIKADKFGIVYIGRAASRLTVTGTKVAQTSESAVFLSEFARNVVVRDNEFTDNALSFYPYYLNQYPNIPDIGFEGILFQHNHSRAVTRKISVSLMNHSGDARFWTFRDNTTATENGNVIGRFIGEGYNGPLSTRRNYYVLDNSIVSAVSVPYGGEGFYVRPLWYGNNTPRAFEINDYTQVNELQVAPRWDKVALNETSRDGRPISFRDALPAYPVGFEVYLSCIAPTTGAELPADPTWNTLSRNYMIYKGAVAHLRLNADRKFDLISYTGPTGPAPTVTTGPRITARGFFSFSLSPTEEATFNDHVGIADGETVQIAHNANVNIRNTARVRTPGGQTFYATAPGTLVGTRIGDVLYLTQDGYDTTLPAPPGFLTALHRDRETVLLLWRNQSTDNTTLILQRKLLGAADFTDLVTLPPTATRYTDLTPATNPAAQYRIRAINATGVRDSRIVTASRTLVDWRATNLGASANDPGSPLGDHAADPDGDGLQNLLEYATSRHPNKSDVGTGVINIIPDARGGHTLGFTRRATPDLHYMVEHSTDLVTWTTIATLPPGADPIWQLAPGLAVPNRASTRVNITVPPPATTPAPPAFYRLRVSY